MKSYGEDFSDWRLNIKGEPDKDVHRYDLNADPYEMQQARKKRKEARRHKLQQRKHARIMAKIEIRELDE